MDYDPSADLEKIKARLLAINFADDAINPPELGVLEAGVARIPGARYVVVPASPQTQGHYTSMQAALWKAIWRNSCGSLRGAAHRAANSQLGSLPAPRRGAERGAGAAH